MQGPKWPFLLLLSMCGTLCGRWDRLCTLGRAPQTKETLPDFVSSVR